MAVDAADRRSRVSPIPAVAATPWERVTERCPAEPRDVGELRMRGPEALRAGDALTGVFERRMSRCLPFLRLMVAVCVLRSPTPVLPPVPVDCACYMGVLGSLRAADAGQDPAEWHELLDACSYRRSVRLGVLTVTTGQRNEIVRAFPPVTGGVEREARQGTSWLRCSSGR